MVFMDAPFGLIGLETVVPIIFTELVHKRFITVSQMIEKMSVNPARILKIERGTLKAGAVADVTIFDPNKRYTIRADKFFSRSRNTPFDGKKCRGAVDTTIVGGRIIFSKGKILEEKGG